jgi:hypothetical protein
VTPNRLDAPAVASPADAPDELFARLVERCLAWPCPTCGTVGICDCYAEDAAPDAAQADDPEPGAATP